MKQITDDGIYEKRDPDISYLSDPGIYQQQTSIVPIHTALQEYAEGKISIKIIEDRLEKLKPQIKEEIETQKHNLKNNLGTFYTTSVTYYSYDEKTNLLIKKLEDKIKEIKLKAQEKGKATARVSETLTFKPRVEKVVADEY